MNSKDSKPKRVVKWFLIGISLVGLFALVNGCGQIRESKKRAFERFFVSVPVSVQVITYGGEKSIFGDGSYVLAFKIPETDLRGLLEQQGYKAVDIESDPGRWRLTLCNRVLQRLGSKDMLIEKTFDCYSKENVQNQARVFYDKEDRLAIFIGFGRFPK